MSCLKVKKNYRKFGEHTLFAEGNLIGLVRLSLSLVGDLAGDGTGHIELVDVQSGLAKGWHGGVHACIAIGGTAEGGQIQSLPSGDDGDVEGQFAAPIGGRSLSDGQRWWGRELAAGTGWLGRLSVEELVVLAARKKQLQGSECEKEQDGESI